MIEQKICHYFNAAFQAMSLDDQQDAHVSVKDTRHLLNTVIEGSKRAIDSLIKRSEQFIKLHKSSIQNQKGLLQTVTSASTIGGPSPRVRSKDKKKNSKLIKVEHSLRQTNSQSIKTVKGTIDTPSESQTSRQDVSGAFDDHPRYKKKSLNSSFEESY